MNIDEFFLDNLDNSDKWEDSSIRKTLSPKMQSKYDKLTRAASEVFLEQSFAEANMSEIVKKAGGSLSTLYKIFGNKQNLFSEVLYVKSEEIFNVFMRSNIHKNENIESYLYRVAVQFCDVVLQDDVISFQRIIVAEGYKNNSELGKIFAKVVRYSASHIQKYFEVEKNKGNIDIDNTLLAAYQFLHTVKEPMFYFKTLGLDINTSEESTKIAIKQAVKIFTQGIIKNK